MAPQTHVPLREPEVEVTQSVDRHHRTYSPSASKKTSKPSYQEVATPVDVRPRFAYVGNTIVPIENLQHSAQVHSTLAASNSGWLPNMPGKRHGGSPRAPAAGTREALPPKGHRSNNNQFDGDRLRLDQEQVRGQRLSAAVDGKRYEGPRGISTAPTGLGGSYIADWNKAKWPGADGLPSEEGGNGDNFPYIADPRISASASQLSTVPNLRSRATKEPMLNNDRERKEVSYYSERPGHGQTLKLGQYADFTLPPSAIPNQRGGGVSDMWLPNLEALIEKGAGMVKESCSLHKAGMVAWYRDMFPNKRPAGMSDVIELEVWLKTKVGELTRLAVQCKERRATRAAEEAERVECLSEEAQAEYRRASTFNLTDSASVSLDWDWDWLYDEEKDKNKKMPRQIEINLQEDNEFLDRMVELYGQAHRELVRQVACGCMERGRLMAGLWSGKVLILSQIKQTTSRMQDQLATLHARVNELEHSRTHETEQLEKLQKLLTKVLAENEGLQKNNDRLVFENSSMNKHLEEMKEQFNKMATDLQTMSENLSTEHAGRQKLYLNLQEVMAEKSRLEQEKRDLEVRFEERDLELAGGMIGGRPHTPRPLFMDAELHFPAHQSTELKVRSYEAELKRLREELEAALAASGDTPRKGGIKDVEGIKNLLSRKRSTRSTSSSYKFFSWPTALDKVRDYGEGDEAEIKPWFVPLGEGNNIPKFLRCSVKVRNRQITKRDTEKLVKKVWKEKAKNDLVRDKAGQEPMQLEAFMYIFLKKEFGIEALIPEMGYNLLRSLDKFSYDADCELFLKVLCNEVHEEVYWSQCKQTADMEYMFETLDERSNCGIKKGQVPYDDFKTALRQFYHNITDEEFSELMSSLREAQLTNHAREWKNKQVVYTTLFEEDRNFDQGPFAEAVRDLHLKLNLQYLQDMQKILDEAKDENDEVTFSDVKQMFKIMDPGISDKQLQEYIGRGFTESFDYLQNQLDNNTTDVTVGVSQFMSRMKTGNPISRSGQVKSSDLNKTKVVKNAQKRGSIINALAAVTDKWERATQLGTIVSGGKSGSKKIRSAIIGAMNKMPSVAELEKP